MVNLEAYKLPNNIEIFLVVDVVAALDPSLKGPYALTSIEKVRKEESKTHHFLLTDLFLLFKMTTSSTTTRLLNTCFGSMSSPLPVRPVRAFSNYGSVSQLDVISFCGSRAFISLRQYLPFSRNGYLVWLGGRKLSTEVVLLLKEPKNFRNSEITADVSK